MPITDTRNGCYCVDSGGFKMLSAFGLQKCKNAPAELAGTLGFVGSPPAILTVLRERAMSWRRLNRQAPAALFTPSGCLYRHLVGRGYVTGISPLVRVPKEKHNSFRVLKQMIGLGLHFNRFSARSAAKGTKCHSLFAVSWDYESFGIMIGRFNISTAFSSCQFSTSIVSVNMKEVIKSFEDFISTTQVQMISVKEMYRVYFERLCRSGKLSDAYYLLRYLHDEHVHLDLDLYNILLSSACEENDFNLFSESFKILLFSNIPPDQISYSYVAKAFQKVDDLYMVIKFIKEVSEITSRSDPTVINRIIFVTAKSGQIHKSLLIFEELKKLNSKIDKVTFNTVLVILGRAGHANEMLSEFKLMKNLGHAPDIVTYTTLVNCLRRLGKLDLCKIFAREMLDQGIEMDLLTYTALIDAFGRAGHVDDAISTFVEMKKSNPPSIYVYRSLISNLKKAGKLEQALNLFTEMNSGAVKLAGAGDFKAKKKERVSTRQME